MVDANIRFLYFLLHSLSLTFSPYDDDDDDLTFCWAGKKQTEILTAQFLLLFPLKLSLEPTHAILKRQRERERRGEKSRSSSSRSSYDSWEEEEEAAEKSSLLRAAGTGGKGAHEGEEEYDGSCCCCCCCCSIPCLDGLTSLAAVHLHMIFPHCAWMPQRDIDSSSWQYRLALHCLLQKSLIWHLINLDNAAALASEKSIINLISI